MGADVISAAGTRRAADVDRPVARILPAVVAIRDINSTTTFHQMTSSSSSGYSSSNRRQHLEPCNEGQTSPHTLEVSPCVMHALLPY